MNSTAGNAVSIGLAAFALPAAAQEFYAGGALSFGEIDLGEFYGNASSDIQSLDVFGGARFDLGSNFFVGVELQAGFGDGYIVDTFTDAGNADGFQGELHIGYAMDWGRIYGFAGLGKTDLTGLGNRDVTTESDVTLGGAGADIAVSDNLSVRVEIELSTISVTDNCCGTYDATSRELSVGAVYAF